MSQQNKSPHEDLIMAAIIGGLLAALAWAIWYFFSVQLTGLVRWIRVGELYFVKLIFGGDLAVQHPRYGTQTVNDWLKYMKNVPVDEIGMQQMKVATQLALVPLEYVFVGLIAVMGVITMWKGPGTQYRRRMNLEGLMKEQAKSFPAIEPFLKFDPRTMANRPPGAPVPAELPLFAEALSPEEWMAHNEVAFSGGRIDMNAAYRGLIKQLGRRWRGPEKLPLHMQALYAACALKHVRKRKDSELLLNELSKGWSPKGGLKLKSKTISQIKKIIRDPKTGQALKKYADQHAYETTALLRCLSTARSEGGVLAPAEFLWLRGHDRTLWYPMNNLGRKSFNAEASGAMVHYTNELIAGQKIPTPRFEEVIRGLEAYMKSDASRNIPPLEGKKKK